MRYQTNRSSLSDTYMEPRAILDLGDPVLQLVY